jgi:LmbE family N-acetylglucosaminyl deacetylase
MSKESKLKVGAVIEHPDDELMGFIYLTKLKAAGAEIIFIRASDGEAAFSYDAGANLHPNVTAQKRIVEFDEAAKRLGVSRTYPLYQPDHGKRATDNAIKEIGSIFIDEGVNLVITIDGEKDRNGNLIGHHGHHETNTTVNRTLALLEKEKPNQVQWAVAWKMMHELSNLTDLVGGTPSQKNLPLETLTEVYKSQDHPELRTYIRESLDVSGDLLRHLTGNPNFKVAEQLTRLPGYNRQPPLIDFELHPHHNLLASQFQIAAYREPRRGPFKREVAA